MLNHTKTMRKLNVNSYTNYVKYMIEIYLLISVGYLGLLYFCNEQLESTARAYALREPRFNNCYNTERISNFTKKFLQFSCTL